MTLYEYIQTHDEEEVTVFDADYDMETYFFKDVSDDEWDKNMTELAKLLEVVEEHESGVSVNLNALIEKLDRAGKIDELFTVSDIDDIMYSMTDILAGYASEKWLARFVQALKDISK